jgi:hypothetical protein
LDFVRLILFAKWKRAPLLVMAMGPKTPTTESAQERERLLAQLSPRDRRLVEDVMAAHPKLTAAEAIEHLTAFGGL